MIEDVYDPLLRYRNEFAAKFSQLSLEKFRELVEKSGIDVQENRKTIAEIKKLTSQANFAKGKLTLCSIVIFLAICVFIAGLVWMYYNYQRDITNGVIALIISGIITIFTSIKCAKISKVLNGIELNISQKTKLAWKQMSPLNNLYTWDIPVKLIEKTVPRLQFDSFFTEKRLDDLYRLFGWNDSFNENKSILNAQSGIINGNPFVLAEYLEQTWGTHTYTGSKTIYWTERIIVDGKSRTVHRSETLYAHVKKPIPVYTKDKVLIYGNNASPNLSFSRKPSELSDDGNGFFERLRKKRVINKLKAYSRNLQDESDFTLMSNHDFEALFFAKNRDNEVEFRLLFTAMAQKQMLDLLKDYKVGYGDDFTFIKDKKINLIFAEHLKDAIIDTNPKNYHDFDFDKASLNFKNFNDKFFKDVYFTIAPILAIPAYQQTRTFEDIYKDVIDTPASSWEFEANANFLGEKHFQHPLCITQNILKTQRAFHDDNMSIVNMVAHGYKGITHTEYVDTFGGDGNWHSVPVDWVEYIPVKQTTQMCVSSNKTFATSHQKTYSNGKWRRSLYSYIN